MAKGRVTIPTDANYVEGTRRIAALWGADAVRDCDGTTLPKNAKEGDLIEENETGYFLCKEETEALRRENHSLLESLFGKK